MRSLKPTLQDSSELRVSVRYVRGLSDQTLSTHRVPTFPSVSELMTMPRALKLLLIFFASSSVCPVAPVLPTFSDPAKSTRYKLPDF